MPVYVDKAQNQYRSMKMCHMIADTKEELFEMVDKIGVHRKWFQSKSIPHFDICQTKRRLAIQNGAIEINNQELVEIIKRIRNGNP